MSIKYKTAVQLREVLEYDYCAYFSVIFIPIQGFDARSSLMMMTTQVKTRPDPFFVKTLSWLAWPPLSGIPQHYELEDLSGTYNKLLALPAMPAFKALIRFFIALKCRLLILWHAVVTSIAYETQDLDQRLCSILEP